MAKITLEDGTILTGEFVEFEEEVSEVDALLEKCDELLELEEDEEE
jgi:hypothetical protein